MHRYGSHRDQFGEFTLPGESHSGLHPVAVLIHGGFWRARYQLKLQHPLTADLAAKGWAVWNLEYRRLGWRSRGGYPATLEDVATAIDHLTNLDHPLDLAKVTAIGHSAGGQLALWAASRPEPKINLAGAVGQAAVTDLREAERLQLSSGVTSRFLGGPPDKVPERYDLASPIERLPLGTPQLLVHGDADNTVPVELARRYAQRAAEAGDDCELVVLPGCGHFEHLDPASAAWAAVTDWLARR